jgi:hypothetical protein
MLVRASVESVDSLRINKLRGDHPIRVPGTFLNLQEEGIDGKECGNWKTSTEPPEYLLRTKGYFPYNHLLSSRLQQQESRPLCVFGNVLDPM